MRKGIIVWVAGLLMLGTIFGCIYFITQQIQRSEANNPQIEIATDIATELNNGVSPTDAVQGNQTSANTTQAPFVVIYDQYGNPIVGSAELNFKLPTVPIGVLTDSKGQDYSFVTWQPESNLRFAAVTVHAKNYYVLSARSLVEVEKLEARTLALAVTAWLFSAIVWTLIVVASSMAHEKEAFTKQWFLSKRLLKMGWKPVRWEGWLVMLVLPAVVLLNFLRLMVLARNSDANGSEFIIETVIMVLLALGASLFMKRKV